MVDVLEYTTTWVKGEVFQGKIMLFIGILLVIAAFTIFRNDNALLRGMLIPIGLMILLFIGYGGMQVASRPAHITKVAAAYSQNPKKAIDMEHEKVLKDDKSYSILKPIWAICIGISIVLYFIFSTHYLKGLSIGLAGLFFTALVVDSILHYRVVEYMKGISGLLQQ